MKRKEPENVWKKTIGESEEGDSIFNIGILVITAILAFILDLYDLASAFSVFIPPFDTIFELVILPLELASAILFWIYSKEKAARAKILINILRSSYFIEIISDFIPTIGRIIDFLPLRTIALILSFFIGKTEEILETTFKKLE
ncbi:MAG: hypothetical protein QXD43_05380 [Candidatus Aenigmatarchaeota archaeon]